MHPRFRVGPAERAVLELWDVVRPGMAGWGPLPFRGGWAEQPAYVMACFEEIRRCEALLRPDQAG